MLFKAALAFVACLVPTLASANDETLQFQIESELAYLKVGYGIETLTVEAEGVRTRVIIGVDSVISNFSDVMWDTAQRASLMSPAPILLLAVEQHSAFGSPDGKKLCYLRARKGQVFEGTC
ncbi:hypothetical protein [Mesorhizobium sp. B2-7-1]|uniref:hypothetical protein n=1 Tax=Mesorhizobium sp. B2-7-1 TaxID=2589909 RepID=UPI001125CC83|nr:hypothetical protein [Mesorhizobium sp. B2-7-1]TPJ46850.1 hypothetical protein FJ471_31445 [Mesorhizobium sp. B2-7-1]